MPNNLPRSKSLWYRTLRIFVYLRRQLTDFWHHDSGNWSWVVEEKRPMVAVNRSLWKASIPSFRFYMLLSLSTIISTLGLLSGSAAAIIGAMIIAPMMGPIIAMAYAITVGNRRLLSRSILTTVKGIILAIVVSILITIMIGIKTPNSEILIRMQPTLIDLGIALAAGAAGSFAQARRRVENALPGVAISVALLPPLSVIGIGLAWGNQGIAVGSSILFSTNLVGIVFSGCIVFLCHDYGSIERAKRSLVAAGITLLLLTLPLGWSLRNILIHQQISSQVNRLISRQSLTFANAEIQRLDVRPELDAIFIEIDVAASPGSISQEAVALVSDFLSKRLEQPVYLKVRVIPTDFFEAESLKN